MGEWVEGTLTLTIKQAEQKGEIMHAISMPGHLWIGILWRIPAEGVPHKKYWG